MYFNDPDRVPRILCANALMYVINLLHTYVIKHIVVEIDIHIDSKIISELLPSCSLVM